MQKKGKDYIIFPLDVASAEEAMLFVNMLSEQVGMFKVGLELFIRSGPDIVRRINDAGSAAVFLDLKLHDIPNTVYHAMEGIRDLGVSFVTVHCGENRNMLKAAVDASQGKTGVLGVTVLTSVSGQDLRDAGFREEFTDPKVLALRRASEAQAAGCVGIVCSGQEISIIKSGLGQDFVVVVPGIRPQWSVSGPDDQRRVTTPATAVRAGADYLVIGRPIRQAKIHPTIAAARIADEIAAATE